MPLPLPPGRKIQVIYKKIAGNYEMPSMEAALDHYALGFMIHGDRLVITPTMTFELHPGYVGAMAPYFYHKTIPMSDAYYENILIKFSPEFVKPLSEQLGEQVLEQIYKYPPKSFSDEVREKVFALAWEMLEVWQDEMADIVYKEFKLQNLLFRVLLLIYEKAVVDGKADLHHTVLSQRIMEAVYYMEKNYMNPMKIEDVAKVSGYSVSYFSRLFETQLGTPFSEYLCNIRLKHIQDALLTTDKTVLEIALENGFAYPGNMSSSFKKKFGMTPLQFRKRQM